jgi:hypothetical protein
MNDVVLRDSHSRQVPLNPIANSDSKNSWIIFWNYVSRLWIIYYAWITADLSDSIVSTAFVYYPRSRPARPYPAPLQYLKTIFEPFQPTSEWDVHEFTLESRIISRPDIVTKLYLPSSRTFSITQPIPFYLTVESTKSVSLAAFLPFSPINNASKVTRMQMLRQSAVDVRCVGQR